MPDPTQGPDEAADADAPAEPQAPAGPQTPQEGGEQEAVAAATATAPAADAQEEDSAPADEAPAEVQDEDVRAVGRFRDACAQLMDEIRHVIVGQQEVIEQVLLAMFSRGHCLLEGVPGLAKTLLVRTLADVLSLRFMRIQFTPDLMPSDITGTEILREDKTTGHREFEFVRGPLFANIVLADEINRTPPKTQAALLEAMQEHRVTASGNAYVLDEPFLVLATQNPIEQEGTYPLPEAQLDRFMFNIIVDYPAAAEELDIVKQVTGTYEADLSVALTGEDILRLQQVVRRVPVAEHVFEYARDLARATRPGTEEAPDFVTEMVAWGAGGLGKMRTGASRTPGRDASPPTPAVASTGRRLLPGPP